MAELLRKAELPPAERLAGSAVFWVLFLGFLLAGLDALGFAMLSALRDQLGAVLPRVVGGLVILGVGLVLANVAWRVVLLAAVNAGWPSARIVGGAVYLLLVTIVAAMALDHVGFAHSIVVAAFAIFVGASMLALAIAVGVGAGPLVRRLLDDRLAARPRPGDDGSSHL
jgi:sterol desaturase/sphingolipid hydroxylase (fatty acid hydroxylase superfamily)